MRYTFRENFECELTQERIGFYLDVHYVSFYIGEENFTKFYENLVKAKEISKEAVIVDITKTEAKECDFAYLINQENILASLSQNDYNAIQEIRYHLSFREKSWFKVSFTEDEFDIFLEKVKENLSNLFKHQH